MNVFIGCDSGIVLNYTENQWIKQTTGNLARLLNIQELNSNEIYATGFEIDQPPHDLTFYYFFKYNEATWEVLDSFVRFSSSPPAPFGSELWASGEGTMYSIGDDGLYEWQNNTWKRSSEEQWLAIYGNNWNNIFIGGRKNKLKHFNGKEWFLLEELSDDTKRISTIWCDSNNVFVVSRVNNQSLIYRGKLKE